MSVCPGSTADGCRCPEHHPGLLEYASEPAALQASLDQIAAAQRRLHVVTMPVVDGPPCDGSMTCSCERCVRDRMTPRRRAVRQPWDPRPSRRAA